MGPGGLSSITSEDFLKAGSPWLTAFVKRTNKRPNGNVASQAQQRLLRDTDHANRNVAATNANVLAQPISPTYLINYYFTYLATTGRIYNLNSLLLWHQLYC